MEATAALGIAGNVVQFIDFSQKLCHTFSQIYQSATGATKHNDDTEILLNSFTSSLDVLSTDLSKYCAHLSTDIPADASSNDQVGDEIRAVVENCRGLAVDLQSRLDSIKMKGQQAGKRKAILVAIKAMWKESDFRDLEQTLNRFRKELQWTVIVSLRKSFDLLESRQKDQFETLQSSMCQILHRLIQDNMTPLPAWPCSVPDMDMESPRVAFNARFHGPRMASMPQILGSNYAGSLVAFEETALKSLAFSVMPHRETDVAVAEAATFDWVFSKPQHRERSWSDFHHWLVDTDLESPRLYWINGKAGSGKSTLMKHLVQHQKTQSALQTWAGSTKLLLSSFFFWHSGHELQRSQVGLLRALLYGCLKNHRELIPVVLSGTENMNGNDLADYWTLTRLQEAFERLVSQTFFDIKFAFFIDGLDEYSGSHGEIAGILKQVSQRSNVKVCVSSRPLLVFDRIFDSFPYLVLQDLTYDDINLYVNNKLGGHERMRTLEECEPGLRASLASAIVNKASGVFLWVHLVVRSLLDGLGNYDVGEDLRRRLNELPEELEALYWLMVQNVKPAWYLEEGFRLLRMVKASPSGVTLLRLLFAETSHNPKQTIAHLIQESWDKQDALCRDLAGRIKSRCLGLLETEPDPGPGIYGAFRHVGFIHKSVFDFLDTETAQSRILACPGQADFVPHTALLRGCLLEIKGIASWVTEGLPFGSWNEKVVPLILDFMDLAQATEDAIQDPSVALLGSFKKTLDDLWWQSVINKNDGTEYWTAASEDLQKWLGGTTFGHLMEKKKAVSFTHSNERTRLPKGLKTFEELCLHFGLELYAAEMGFLPPGRAGGGKNAHPASVSLDAAEVLPPPLSNSRLPPVQIRPTEGNVANQRRLPNSERGFSGAFPRLSDWSGSATPSH